MKVTNCIIVIIDTKSFSVYPRPLEQYAILLYPPAFSFQILTPVLFQVFLHKGNLS